MRILLRIGEGDCPDGDALYDFVRTVDWTCWIDPGRTLAVSAVCRDSALAHTQFVAQRTKDGIVDQQRDRDGRRSSVDKQDADLRVFVHLVRDRATLFLDVSGEPLHLRGYRTKIGEAPLKETLAAAILRLSGWDRRSPLLDPLCGSGTLPIEADGWARQVAPGILRPRFGLERWLSHEPSMARSLDDLRADLRARELREGPEIEGRDQDPQMVAVARDNAARARANVRFSHRDLDTLEPREDQGLLVCNPPYGARLSVDVRIPGLLARATTLRPSWSLAALSGGPDFEGACEARGLRFAGRFPLWNGELECRLLVASRGAAARP